MSTIHENMVQRCTNPKATSYRHYGGRGISVCDRWRHGDGGMSGAECFRADMGPCPRGLTLDRLNNDGNYEPSNCTAACAGQGENNGMSGAAAPGRRKLEEIAYHEAAHAVAAWGFRLPFRL